MRGFTLVYFCVVFLLPAAVQLHGAETNQHESDTLLTVSDIKGLSDTNVTRETAWLFENLKQTGRQGLIFGHHNACLEGQHWKENNLSSDLRSDCQASVGDFPGLFGFDLGWDYPRFKAPVEEIYRRGGIITFSWHARNPVTGGGYKDAGGNPVAAILEGGEHWETWRQQLEQLGDFLNSLYVDSVNVPVIFRPFHENTGSWFWWGTGNCTDQEYIDLWRLTVDYLRGEKGVDNMLMAYSPSKPALNEDLARSMYPGDDYVDIIGFDSYGTNADLKELIVESAKIICEWAASADKVSAITETGIRKGLQNSTSDDWFTAEFLDLIKDDSATSRVAYVLTWRNSAPDSYWVPLHGQPAHDDFLRFYHDPYTLFLHDLNGIYQSPGQKKTFRVNIRVRESGTGAGLSGCRVRINGEVIETDSTGQAGFSGVPRRFLMSVMRENYSTHALESRQITKDTAIAVYLSREDYSVSIQIIDSTSREPVSGTSVLIGENSEVTDNLGRVNMAVGPGTYEYLLERPYYLSRTDSVHIQSDTLLTISLIRTHASIKFKLFMGTRALNEASVILFSDSTGNDTLITNNLGIANLSGLPVGIAYQYRITRTGFDTLSGSVYLETDTSLIINMVPYSSAGIHIGKDLARIWPNPANSVLFIEVPVPDHPYDLRLFSQEGRLIRRWRVNQSVTSLHVSDLAAGIYLIRMEHGVVTASCLFIKQ